MINFRDFIRNFEHIRDRLLLRGIGEDELLEIRDLCVELSSMDDEIISLNARRNSLIRGGDNPEVRGKIRSIKDTLSGLTLRHREIMDDVSFKLMGLPNLPDESVGANEVVVRTWGEKGIFSFKPRLHFEIARDSGMLDLSSAAEISGSGYAVYSGEGARLFRALINFTLALNGEKGYEQYYLPVVLSGESLEVTAQLPKFKGDLFTVSGGKYLSPTSESQLVNLFRNRIISRDRLPIKLTSNTNCFRLEAGAAGADTHGVIRMHQFNKTELVVICEPEQSFNHLEGMMMDACDILEKLNLHYRVILLPYHDMSFSSSKTYDIEVWFPAEGRYREISSISNTLDFQSRRGKIRFKGDLMDAKEKSRYPHILNGSSLAIDRLFAALVENYQAEDGSVRVPEILKGYY